MTTDERLDKIAASLDSVADRIEALTARHEALTARHEALTQSVELLGKMQQKTDREIRLLGRFIRVIVLDHETRLLALEGKADDGDDAEEK
jgi:cell division protein FtsB